MLRPLEPGEDAALLAVFDGLSARSRELRFLTAMNTLRPSVVRALTDVDGCRHVAWLATVDGRPAGIARYARIQDGPADLAFEVADAQQGRGAGVPPARRGRDRRSRERGHPGLGDRPPGQPCLGAPPSPLRSGAAALVRRSRG